MTSETSSKINVFFDDFTVTHLGVDILQTAEYYPMGLAFNTWAKGKEKHRFMCQNALQNLPFGPTRRYRN